MASGLFRRWKKGFHPFKEQENEFEEGTGSKRFSYRELAVATNNFSDQLVIGEGAFGSLYKGFLQDMSLAVAIKRVSHSSNQGRKEYATEVRVINRLRHRHLVQLVGWCHGGGELLLVYELMPNGSLDKHLHSANMSPLPWPCRHKVVLGIASAILYLHEDAEQCVVHGDIKPSNVMLDASFNAKLGDFGVSTLINHAQGPHSTTIIGTDGYLDPEYMFTGRVTVKSDIYSFGVLLLEIACGRRPIMAMGEEVVYLVKWVRESYGRGIILDAADTRLNGEFDVEEIKRVMVVGLWCTEPDESLRPSIRRVVNVLRSEAPLPSLPARYAFDYTSSIATGGSGSTGTTQSTEAVNMLQSEVPSQMPVATFLPPPDVFDCSSSLATGASSSGGGRSTGTLFIGDHNPIGGLQMDSEEHARDLLESMLLDASVEPTDMPLSLLKSITNNFSNDRQIGVGGFAVVYKGLLRNGAVAVKKLTKTLDVHEAKFNQEVDSLLRVKHKNVVRFLGYCSDTQGKVWKLEGRNVMAEERQRFLCFEYLPEGSLDNYISDASQGLEWMTRFQIIKGICEGLHYLHQQKIVHLDLKPANILLDRYKVPKIADFGLSKCFDEKQTRAMTSKVIGSQGYMAPEYYGGIITFKSDIYSLGIVITEILTGQKGYPEIENVLQSWSARFGTSQGDIRLEPVRICAKIGIECIDSDPAKRPVTQCIIERLAKVNEDMVE